MERVWAEFLERDWHFLTFIIYWYISFISLVPLSTPADTPNASSSHLVGYLLLFLEPDGQPAPMLSALAAWCWAGAPPLGSVWVWWPLSYLAASTSSILWLFSTFPFYVLLSEPRLGAQGVGIDVLLRSEPWIITYRLFIIHCSNCCPLSKETSCSLAKVKSRVTLCVYA